MKKTRYFRNKNQFDSIDPDTLWKLQGKYMVLANNKKQLSVYYESHEHWFYEVETPDELK